ncbi:hypothetical protein EE612_000327 [Oryza sativa]|nr:hypothetical protein EE612_000327 [Oryza sativa]
MLFASSRLLDKDRRTRDFNLPTVGGTNPLNLLPSRYTSVSDDRLNKEEGMTLLNWFTDRTKCCMLGNLSPMLAGMLPLSLFSYTWRTVSFDRFHMEGGNSLERLFPSRPIFCRFGMFPRLDGIRPFRWLKSNFRNSSDDRFASEAGIGPVKLLFPRWSFWSHVSVLPNFTGMWPLSWL